MKTLGVILIGLGLALLAYVGYNFIQNSGKIVSPVPVDRGVKVIFVTPTPQ
jgi:hypothetical protein